MRRSAMGTAAVGIVLGATLGLAGTASAASFLDGSAADAINQLKAQGYTVQLNLTNGYPDVPLSECKVLGVHGLSGTDSAGKPLTPAQIGTVYVDVNCPDDND
jgi:hypothetical protein